MTTKGKGRKPKRVVKQWAIKFYDGTYITGKKREVSDLMSCAESSLIRVEIRELP